METESETGKSMQETEHNTADEARQKRYIYITDTYTKADQRSFYSYDHQYAGQRII